jgi:hypothetical protein
MIEVTADDETRSEVVRDETAGSLEELVTLGWAYSIQELIDPPRAGRPAQVAPETNVTLGEAQS